MKHTCDNDDYYDKEIEYKVQWWSSNDTMNYIICKTLKELFKDFYNNDKELVFNTQEKKQNVRDALNKEFYYKMDGLEIIQFDLSADPKCNNNCSCPLGFKGEGAFCKVHRD